MRDRVNGRTRSAWFALFAVAAAVCSVLLGGCGIVFQNHEKRADATLTPTPGNTARGTVTLIERADGVQISYNLVDMPPNSDHALQVHERGDCIAVNGDASPVFALPSDRGRAGSRLEGELGNIHADATGAATGFMVATDVSLDGVRSVISRAIMLHREAADPYALSPHNVGPTLACGVIRR
ncbi:superoxide dismutase family protein [Caballeronia sp. M1242]|uniref:superoxide dismutase family protein n=1 Tax=Caballeronia sp. M1242 TaxID=2814653 RepID=UPI0019D14141|nr:superoxide dismutase family protein [Caballeronia sp. M1242]QSN61899.1 superoxide dismutase family protein [Caballeronia sp. M1242]